MTMMMMTNLAVCDGRNKLYRFSQESHSHFCIWNTYRETFCRKT